jgi:hypothetical protein
VIDERKGSDRTLSGTVPHGTKCSSKLPSHKSGVAADLKIKQIKDKEDYFAPTFRFSRTVATIESTVIVLITASEATQ